MTMSRSKRLVTVLVALFSLLFMQLAVAAYACPGDAPQVKMADCAGMDQENPSLCHAHNQAGKQSLDKAQVPSLQPFLAARVLIEVVHLEQAVPDGAQVPASFLLASTAAPPIAIRHCCLRI